MSYLIDDVARTLASPVSRRETFKRIARLLGGVGLLALRAKATTHLKCGQSDCNMATFDCANGLVCVPATGTGTCQCPGGTCCCKPGSSGSCIASNNNSPQGTNCNNTVAGQTNC